MLDPTYADYASSETVKTEIYLKNTRGNTKMATKDWKNLGKDTWQNKKDLDYYLIISKTSKRIKLPYIITTSKGFQKLFNSKSEALKFAKKYMRLH